MKTSLAPVLFVSAFLLASSAQAAAVAFASRASFNATFPGASIENWDSYASGTTIVNGGTLGGITYNSSSGDSIVTNSYLPSTSPNTLGNTASSPLGFFRVGDSVTFSFGTALTAFAIDFNTFATAAGTFTLTTNTGEVVGSVFDPFGSASPSVGAPLQPVGQFAGFSSAVAFTSVTVQSPGQASYTLDTLRFVGAPVGVGVPDSGLTLILLGSTLGAIAAFRRKFIGS